MKFGATATKLKIFDSTGAPLLRSPQHGAALAACAHFTARHEAAAIALPTGVGKTAVMTLLPYLLAATKALVVVPTRLLREQIADEFSTLSVLRRSKVVPTEVWSPRTSSIRNRTDTTKWSSFDDSDVVVTAPNSIVAASGECTVPDNYFDLVLFDEAHHTPAPIWSAVIQRTHSAKQVFFTATPYRRDERRIQATVVYEFSLNEAVTQGFVAPVDLRLIDDTTDIDAAMIREVLSLVRNQSSEYFRVPFIARTSSKDHAIALSTKYSKAGLVTRVILDNTSLRNARKYLDDVRHGIASGIVMVGVLGEGFDFPAIKIAAYHRAHKSLPATLQFVGRVSRISPEGPARAIVLAGKGEGAEETAALYRNDAQWASLIPQLADRLFKREAKRALLDRELITPVQGLVSPSNIRPKRLVDIIAVGSDLTIDVERMLDKDLSVVQWWQTEDSSFLVVIRKVDAPPAWLYSDVLIETEFQLQCAVYARKEGFLFLTSSDSDEFAAFLGIASPERIHPERLYAMLNAQGVEAYFNVGIRSIEIPNPRRPAYKINAGPSVAESILPGDSDTYTLGHAIARITENGRTRSFGIAVRKSRVWMPQSGPLSDYYDWCMSLASLLDRAEPASMAQGLRLRPATPIETFPEVAIAATPGGRLVENNATLTWPDGFEAPLIAVECTPAVSSDRSICEISVDADESHSLVVKCFTSGLALISDLSVALTVDGDPADIKLAFTEDPFRLFFGDGSSSRGFLISSPSPGIPEFPPNSIETLDWQDVDISKETDTDLPGHVGIFAYMHKKLAERYPDSIIINDDGKNEISDIIVLTDRGAHSEAILFHCKGASSKTERVDQMYVVTGQAIRSMRWMRNRSLFWKELKRRRASRSRFRVIRDELNHIDDWLMKSAAAAPDTSFHIVVVQPGLLRSALRPNTAANVLLSSCKGSADASGAQFTVFCSS